MKYGYARVSTTGQARKGTSLEEQTKELLDAGAEKIISDSYTGKTMERPAFTQLKKGLKQGDVLIVTKLDRFCRSMTEGVEAIRELMDRGVTVHVLNMGIVQDTATGRLTLSMLAAVAEFEREMIIERTQSGRAARRAEAEARGEVFRDFRPRKYGDQQTALAMRLLDEGQSFTQVSQQTGISKSTLIRRRRELKAEVMREKKFE